MPNPNIDVLSQKLHFLQNKWGQPSTMGNMLCQLLEAFQIKAGLGSNIFMEDYTADSILVSNGWGKHLWLLFHYYMVDFQFDTEYQIPHPACFRETG